MPANLTPNVPLLRKTLEHITAHPEEWDQTVWMRNNAETACGTAGCPAGTALAIQGYEFEYGNLYSNQAHHIAGGDRVFIGEVAAKELGLDEFQAEELFDSVNSLRDLWALANEITDGEIEIPAQFR